MQRLCGQEKIRVALCLLVCAHIFNMDNHNVCCHVTMLHGPMKLFCVGSGVMPKNGYEVVLCGPVWFSRWTIHKQHRSVLLLKTITGV